MVIKNYSVWYRAILSDIFCGEKEKLGCLFLHLNFFSSDFIRL